MAAIVNGGQEIPHGLFSTHTHTYTKMEEYVEMEGASIQSSLTQNVAFLKSAGQSHSTLRHVFTHVFTGLFVYY